MKKPTRSGARALKTRIKKKSGLKISSRRWLERHMNDPYVHRAKADGYRSRAAFKLIEIDDKHQILKPGLRIVDLGSAPGGWCQVSAARTRSDDENPLVVAIDYLEMDPVPGTKFLKKDFLEDDAPDALIEEQAFQPTHYGKIVLVFDQVLKNRDLFRQLLPQHVFLFQATNQRNNSVAIQASNQVNQQRFRPANRHTGQQKHDA